MERSEYDLGFARVAKKAMPNGETRIRTKLENGISSTTTIMPYWDLTENLPWQEAHFHKGLIENYLVIHGWALYVARSYGVAWPPKERFEALIVTQKIVTHKDRGTVTFPKDVPHMVLLGPNAIIQTTTWGEGVGDPEKNGNDWWPAHPEMTEWTQSFSIEDLDERELSFIRAQRV